LVVLVAMLENAQNTHPFVPIRLKALKQYSESDDYKKILAGEYEHDALGLHEGGERIKCKCGTLVNSKLAFCPECGQSMAAGAELARAGGSGCGTPLPPDTKFCPKCGAKQAAADAPQVSQMDKWKNTAGSFFKR